MKNEDKNKIKDNFINEESKILDEDVTFVDSTEDGEELPTKDIVKKLREEVKTLRKEKEEYLTGWQRAKADYVNLQKEYDHVRLNSNIHAKEKMLEKLLPALDSFEMAFANKNHWEKIDKHWQDGITSIYQQLITGLEKSDIRKINDTGIEFDPKIHFSIKMVNTHDEKMDHLVAEVSQTGYKIGNRVIRPAMVSVYEYKTE